MVLDLHVTDRLVIPSGELQWRFSRASGPGGQGVNTTDSRVELVLDLHTCSVLGPMVSALCPRGFRSFVPLAVLPAVSLALSAAPWGRRRHV